MSQFRVVSGYWHIIGYSAAFVFEAGVLVDAMMAPEVTPLTASRRWDG